MNLENIKIEKIAILLLVFFVIVLFIDYTFNISLLIKGLNVKLEKCDFNRSNLLHFVSISIIPIMGFISYAESKNKSEILVDSIIPFLTFVLGFYLFKIPIFDNILKMILILFVQFLSFLFLFPLILPYLKNWLSYFYMYNSKVNINLDIKRVKNDINQLEEILGKVKNKIEELTKNIS